MIIDEKSDSLRKWNLVIKTLNKYNNESRVAGKQTIKHTSETQELTNIYLENVLKEQKDILR